MPFALLLFALGCACSRERADATRDRAGEPAPSISAPRSIDEKGALSSPVPDDRTSPDGAAPGATAALRTLADSGLSGEVALHQERDGVRIALQVRDAQPGARRVALDRGGCEQRSQQRESASAAVPEQTGLGTLLVDDRGRGALEITLRDADLRPESPNSVRGKALLVYRMLPPAQRGARDEIAVACAEITK